MKLSQWLLIVGVIFSDLLMAQELTMPELFDLIMRNHPLIEQEKLTTEIELRNQNIALTAKNWRISSNPTYFYSQPVDPSTFTPNEIHEVSFTGRAQKAFWSSGGRLSVEWSSNLTDQNLPRITFPTPTGEMSAFDIGLNRFYKNRFFVNYSQPLWQNYKGTLDRLDYELSDFGVHIAKYQSAENQEKFLLKMGITYFDWVLLAEKTDILEERLQLAQEELSFVEKKRDAYLVDQVDVLRAQDAVRIAEQNLMLIRSQSEATRAELAVLAQADKINEMQPQFDLYEKVGLPTLEQAFEKVRGEARNLMALDQQRARLQRLQKSFLEQKEPRLDVNVGAGFVGGNNVLDNSLDLTNPEMRVSLNFSYPLGRQAAAINAQKTELQIRQMDLQYQSVSLDIKSRLADLLIRIREMEDILDLNTQQIESARLRMEEEMQLYEQGRGQMNFVIQSLDNVQNAKLMHAENAAGYQKLVLQYRELTDQIINPSIDKKE